MDNVTHTLVGVLVAHTWNSARARRAEQAGKTLDPGSARALFWAVILGSNLPDFDFLARYLPVSTPQDIRLAYLLHHRGFTHTLLFLPLLALLCAGIALLLWRGPPVSIRERLGRFRWLGIVAGVALLAHFGADFCNDYGVHPFSPFLNRWFYGDTLFILEPSIWLAILPFAVQGSRHRIARVLWVATGVAILVASWFMPVVSLPVAAGLTLGGLAVALAQWRIRGPWPAWTAFAVALWIFIVSGAIARGRAEQTLARLAPAEQFTDFILTPLPGNPFCRRLIALSLDSEGIYRGRIGAHSLWPRAFPPEQCVMLFGARKLKFPGSAAPKPVSPALLPPPEPPHAAPWDEPTLPAEDGIFWQGEYSGSLDLMLELIRANCKFAATLHFARAPFWKAGTHGGLLVGDLRYDRGGDGGFATFEVQGREDCGWIFPSWEMPFFRSFRRDPEDGAGWKK